MSFPRSGTFERRQTPRTPLQTFVYMKLGESNYGSVLNISEQGLCFRSKISMAKIGSVNFSLWEGKCRVDGSGEVIWVDETRKTGGLLFTSLSEAASRELVEHWTRPPHLVLSPTSTDLPASIAPLVAHSDELKPELAQRRWLRRLINAVSQLQVPYALRSFSGGLITGVLVSGLVASAWLFQSFRSQFGALLLRGKHLSGREQTQALATPAAPLRFSGEAADRPEPGTKHSSRKRNDKSQGSKQLRSLERSDLEGSASRVVLRRQNVPRAPSIAALNALPHANMRNGALLLPLVVPPTSPPNSGFDISSSFLPKADARRPTDMSGRDSFQAEHSQPISQISSSEIYCDVATAKEFVHAIDTVKKLALMGFPATTVQKGRLWANAYHVLVGPYDTMQQFKTARKALILDGFHPRAFEKGSRNFTLLSDLTLDGVQLPSGEYMISWESYVREATVRFVRARSMIAVVEGSWVKCKGTCDSDAYIYRRNPDGSNTLLQIRFGGIPRSLVLGKSY